MRRSLVVAFVAACAALVVGILPSINAYASPSAAELEQQINKLWAQAETTIEQYNSVHAKLQANQAKANKLQAQMNPLQLQVDLAYTRVGAMSAQLYMMGPGSKFNAILSAGSPEQLADQLSTLDEIARQQSATVNAAKSQVDAYDKQRQPLDAILTQLKQQDADLAAKKAAIQKQLSQLQSLRLQAYGSGGGTGGSLKPVACPQVYVGGKAGTAVKYACGKIGSPYEFGASGPSAFDCSGLTMAAWGAAGVSLYHEASVQASGSGYHAGSVSLSSLQTGDLIFYGSPIHHVAIYIGNGWVIHAPTSGDHVREARIFNVGSPVGYRRL